MVLVLTVDDSTTKRGFSPTPSSPSVHKEASEEESRFRGSGEK
jgi:hypothetical protein